MDTKRKVKEYSQSNYDRLKESLSTLMESINYQLGFSTVHTDAPLLTELAVRGNVNMYLSLITDLLLLLLLYLSFSLLYNLTRIMVRIQGASPADPQSNERLSNHSEHGRETRNRHVYLSG